jgi:hypothetical protein
LAIGMSAVAQGQVRLRAAMPRGNRQGLRNYLTVVGLCETVGLFVLAFTLAPSESFCGIEAGFSDVSHESVKVGDLLMGGEWPVSIQTMWKDSLPVFSGPMIPPSVRNRKDGRI